MALLKFNIGVYGKILKCAISWKRLIVEQNGWQVGNRGLMYCMCRVLFMSDSLSSVWCHSVHRAKFLMLGTSKDFSSHSFHSISTKLYGKYGNQWGVQATALLAICQKLQIWWHFELLTWGINGRILKCARSWKRLIVGQNGWKFGTDGTLFMSDSLSSVWCHSVHAKFPM